MDSNRDDGKDHGNQIDSRLLLLAPDDNVFVTRDIIPLAETFFLDGEARQLTRAIQMGHKLARCAIREGDKIIKYGAPIGSATCDIEAGEHVHVHNMKSDYIATHSFEDAG